MVRTRKHRHAYRFRCSLTLSTFHGPDRRSEEISSSDARSCDHAHFPATHPGDPHVPSYFAYHPHDGQYAFPTPHPRGSAGRLRQTRPCVALHQQCGRRPIRHHHVHHRKGIDPPSCSIIQLPLGSHGGADRRARLADRPDPR